MVARLLVSLLPVLILESSAQVWRELQNPPELKVSRNASGVLKVGEVLNITCTARGIPEYSTLLWTRAQGHVWEYLTPRGRSPLSQLVRAAPDLHGAEFFCSCPYFEKGTEKNSSQGQMYTIHSERVRLEVEGGTDTVVPNRRGRVSMARTEPVPGVALYTCTQHDLDHAFVEIFLAKGNADVKLYVGYQSPRGVAYSAGSRGAHVFCVATALGRRDYRQLYALQSNRVPASVL